MTVKKFILFGLCVIGLAYAGIAQQKEINFTSLTTEDGLSSNTVNAILKDRYGMIWFGTEDGLDRFDGTRFKMYRHKAEDPTSLRANEVLSLHEDRSGNLWVGTSGGSLNLYDRQKDCFIQVASDSSPHSIRNNVIRSICSDYAGRIWVAHFAGVSLVDPQSRLPLPLPPSGNLPDAFKRSSTYIFQDSRRQLWIGTTQGLIRYNLVTGTATQFIHDPRDLSSLSGHHVNAITEDKTGAVWIGTHTGLSKLSPDSNSFTNFLYNDKDPVSLSSNFINAVVAEDEKLWIGTTEGLNIMNIRTGEITRFEPDPRNIHSLTNKLICSIYIDKEGIYWVGTIRGGINKYDKNLNLFNHVRSNVFDEKGLNASIVTAFEEAEKGKVFVGTEENGLSLFDPSTKLFQHFNIISRRKDAGNVISILTLKMTRAKKLLIGTFSDGLFIMDPVSGKYRQLMQGTGIDELNSNDIFCITELRNGNLWVGTNGEGINILNSDHKVIARYTRNPKAPNDIKLPINSYIRDIREAKNGNIWIATHGGGIAVLQPQSGKFTIYNPSNSKLPNDKVQALCEDSRGFIWAGTLGGGLVLFADKASEPVVFSEKDGLQNSAIYSIVEDESGLIWVSTNKGISSINAITKSINNFNYHNGLQNNNFFRGAGIRLSNGELFFGGLDGFNYFHPAYLVKNKNVPPVLITDLRIANESVAASEHGPIKEHISVAKEISLAFKQNFALDFVGVNYTSPEQNRYAYMLEGFDDDWNYVGNSTTASYTNLDPGDYIFRIKASNNDGVWNNKGAFIKVHVRPPFWKTRYAYALYAVVLISVVLWLRYKSSQRIKKKIRLEQKKIYAEQERRQAERVHDLDRLKIKFLTNLSHEFRTPISLILGPVDKLIEQQKHQPSFRQLDMVKRNARRLLNLVNQLLDFRKMEEQELKVNMTEGELVSFIKDASDSFTDLAERKKIELVFSSAIDSLYTVFDHDKLERILFNVLSNAFKFTNEGGRIRLEVERLKDLPDQAATWIAIRVSDTGIGIPEDKKEKIFELFFQSSTDTSILNQGTGIGLSITKEFIKLHGGTISVESEPGKGTTFNIHIPFTPVTAPASNNEAAAEAIPYIADKEPLEEVTEAETVLSTQTDIPTVLLIEDNDDFRFYLRDNLRLQYKVLEATNGKEGWQKALAQHPQLIVSDINMPEMDGIELSRKIKSDKRTSHIPIILLTAMTGEDEQLKGLNTGANDYITKPFNVELLNAKIRNLLVLNSSLKNTYSKQIKAFAPDIEIQSADELFMQKIVRYLEDNLSNSNLSVEELSRQVNMSRSSLYLKLLELTGQKPVEYIRSFKLEKAAVLLEKSDMTIAQIAYSVGFSTPNYFAKSFKLKFKVLPSEYMKRKNEGNKNGLG